MSGERYVKLIAVGHNYGTDTTEHGQDVIAVVHIPDRKIQYKLYSWEDWKFFAEEILRLDEDDNRW